VSRRDLARLLNLSGGDHRGRLFDARRFVLPEPAHAFNGHAWPIAA
jgi:hypothetical protein